MFGSIVSAQLSIVPQWGIESSKTTLSYNNSPSYSPLGIKLSPHASVRVDYKFKKVHGPFVGLATTRSAVNYTFSNPETGKTNYTAFRDNKQLRLEAGYQVSTKPIYFNKSSSKNKSANISPEKYTSKRSCGESYTRSHCGSKAFKTTAPSSHSAATSKNNNKGSWVSIQPSAGMAFIPTASAAEIATKNNGTINSYEYNAGNWKSAVVAGAGFTFGKNHQEKLVVSINYLRGIGNLQTKNITTTLDSKPTTTYISSTASNWNLRIGIPFSFGKKTAATMKKPGEVKENSGKEKKCGAAAMFRCRKAA